MKIIESCTFEYDDRLFTRDGELVFFEQDPETVAAQISPYAIEIITETEGSAGVFFFNDLESAQEAYDEAVKITETRGWALKLTDLTTNLKLAEA